MKYDQKILIIRFSSIGDIVLSTSPLNTIRKKYPKAKITYLTLAEYSSLLEMHPHIDTLMTINRSTKLSQLFNYNKFLKSKKYTIIYDLHNSIRSRLITLNFNCTIIRLKKPRFNRFLLFFFYINRFKNSFSVPRMYHNSIGEIWRKGDDIPKTFLKISEIEKNEALIKIKKLSKSKKFIVIIPGAAWNQKRWDIRKYVKLINSIKLPVVILGTKSDSICFDIESQSSNVCNLAGKTSLRDAMAIIKNSMYVIGSDTGLSHIAESLNKSVYMILGPTSSETGASVISKYSRVVEKDLWCRPCSQNGKRTCYRSRQFCMDLITVRDVLNILPKY